MREKRHLIGLSLAAAVIAGAVTAPAARADDEALRRELDVLKRRLEIVEKELADRKKAEEKKAATLGDAAALKTKNGSRVLLSGFAEMRATNIGNSIGDRVKNGDFDFQVTRFRPRLTYLLDSNFQATLQLNASTRSVAAASVSARDANIEYDNAAYYIRFGQQKIPYGYEVFRQGDEVSPYLERARVFGSVFPDERDIGIVAGTAPKNPRATSFHIGVMNGDGINRSDGDSNKSLAGKVEVPTGKHNIFGASVYTGTSTTFPFKSRPAEAASLVKQAVGIEDRLAFGRFSARAEYLWGRSLAKNLNGGYGFMGYDTGKIGNFFVRHDIFDPNEDAGSDYWSRTSLGWYKDFTKQFRLTFEYDFVRNLNTVTSNDNTFGLEAQVNF